MRIVITCYLDQVIVFMIVFICYCLRQSVLPYCWQKLYEMMYFINRYTVCKLSADVENGNNFMRAAISFYLIVRYNVATVKKDDNGRAR